MELWTLQHPDVWSALEKEGIWHVNEKHLEFPEHEDNDFNHLHYAYKWYADQMKRRIGSPPKGVRFPVWAYFKRRGRMDGKPDMRFERWFYSGQVDRLRLDVDDDRVLLSDYDEWHTPLNYWFLSRSQAESEAFEEWCRSLGVDFHDIFDWSKNSPTLHEVRKRLEASWSLMFDMEVERDEEWHHPYLERTIQATFWELRREDVVSVEHFHGCLKF